jgi:3'-phosphoadenosine 5'-phosphosulfate sulfotransferase (PAPS reductase)/FAD synthetase
MDSDGDTPHRKLAPGQPGEHPDWFWLTSFGIDSVAAYLLTKDALHENYRTRPVMVYLDTRIGLPFQRLYGEQLADAYGEQLWTLRTHEKFEHRVGGRGKFADRDDAGRAPAARDHSDVQNELKGRQRDKLADLCDGKPIYVTGIRKDESPQRAKFPKGEETRKARFVKPCYGLTKADCAEVILRHEECPINPAWVWPHATDCFCLANGDPSEVDASPSGSRPSLNGFGRSRRPRRPTTTAARSDGTASRRTRRTRASTATGR